MTISWKAQVVAFVVVLGLAFAAIEWPVPVAIVVVLAIIIGLRVVNHRLEKRAR